ncbi:MAG: hypothetical protein EXX96DRAFT_577759 [Benjaminiella poitrasii]|nr:MAG: hypothetical protein EXX96DRAFT_577759 [Benjaminiella poitrasii]
MESIDITPSNSQNVEINDDANVKVFESSDDECGIFEWNDLSDYESSELNVSATETVPSLQESIESDDKARETSIAFEEQFSFGRVFNNMNELRDKAMKLGLKFNMPFTTGKSYKPTFIKLICKHGNAYRKAEGKEETLATAESINEEEDSIIKKPH